MENCLKDAGKSQYVRCLKCKKIISCSRYDTTKLIEHIRKDHPEVTVVESGCSSNVKQPTTTAPLPPQPPPPPPPCPCKCRGRTNDANNISIPDANEIPCPMTRSQKGHLFRTSLEHWRPANGTIYCPFCSCKKRPLVRIRNERLSGNSWTANCLLACWPFCFLPFLLPSDEKEYLYCSNCKNFLGLYDRNCNCIRPNRQFSERMNKEKLNMGNSNTPC